MQYWNSIREKVDSYTYWHNLGVVYKLKQDFPNARFAFEKANHSTLYSSITNREIAEVESRLGVNPPASTWSYLTDSVASLGAEKAWLLGLLMSGVFILLLKTVRNRKWFLATFTTALLPLCCTYFFQKNFSIVLTMEEIDLYEGPSKVFQTKSVIGRGSKLYVSPGEEWCKVYGPDAEVFWVKRADISAKSKHLWGEMI